MRKTSEELERRRDVAPSQKIQPTKKTERTTDTYVSHNKASKFKKIQSKKRNFRPGWGSSVSRYGGLDSITRTAKKLVVVVIPAT